MDTLDSRIMISEAFLALITTSDAELLHKNTKEKHISFSFVFYTI